MLMSVLYHVTFLTGTACAIQVLDLGNITSSVNKITCAFDMCVIIPNFCLNGGTCLTRKDTCESTCLCSKQHAGNRCDHITEPPRQGNKNAVDVTTKPSNACGSSGCHHGNCIEIQPIGIQCICEDGWFGESCNTYGAVFDSSIFNIPPAEIETNNFLTNENENTLQDVMNRPLISSVFHSFTSTRSPLTSSMSTKSTNVTSDVDDDLEERNVTSELEYSEKIKIGKENDSISAPALSSEIQNSRNASITQKDDGHATKVFSNDSDDISSVGNSSNDDINDNTETKNNSMNALVNSTRTDNGQQKTSDDIVVHNVNNTDLELINVKFNHTIKNSETHEIALERKKYVKDMNDSASLGLNITTYITTTLEFPGEINHISRQETKLAEMKATFENGVNGMGELYDDVDNSLDQKYNVCSEFFEIRPLEERKCEVHDSRLTCVYGECEQNVVDHGSWTGYQTDCKCDYGATGTYCENKCCLDCGINGKCDVVINDDNITEHCNCRQRYTGEFCEIFIPDPVNVHIKESTWYLWIVGVCVGTFVVMVTLSVVAPYFMWKHRVILVMKIVHYFQAYEDDDEKEWDAFVSYKSHPTDERFVTDVLYPKLEQELGFRLCLHFRDFVPGETISNNIINAVEGSRRTIIVLTPRYVESEFTRFEYQKAQTEMLKRKHRIIPIMLEDISGVTSNMDKNLKGIINSVTYLEWPKESEKSKKEEKFWKRLQLSLPKKKVSDSEKDFSPLDKSLTSGANNNQPINYFSDSKNRAFEQQNNLAKHLPVNKSEIFNVSLSDDADEETYFEIGQIDDTLTEMIQPLTDAEEAALVQSQIPNSVQEESLNKLRSDVCYMEFKKEDNPPPPRIGRSQNRPEVGDSGFSARTPSLELDQNTAQYTGNNYLQFKIEDNPQSPKLLRSQEISELTDSRYNELQIDDIPASPSIPRSLIQPEVGDYDYSYSDGHARKNTTDVKLNFAQCAENNFKIEDNPSSASQLRPQNYPDEGIYDYSYTDEKISPPFNLDKNIAHCSENNYIEFKIEDNPPSPSISRTRKPEVTSFDDNYTELEIEGNPIFPELNGCQAQSTDTHMFDGYTDISEKGTSSLHDLNILLTAGSDQQYVEFRAEDNPPSPSYNKLRKQQNMLRKQPNESNTDDDYTDITIESDEADFHVPSPDINDRYINIRTEILCPPNRKIPPEQTTQPPAGITIENNGYIEAEV